MVSNVTPIGGQLGGAPPPATLHPAVRLVLDEQLTILGELIAIVGTAAAAVKQVYDCDALGHPDINRALKAAARMVNDVYGAIIPETLENAPIDPEILQRVKQLEEENDPEYQDRLQAAIAADEAQRQP